MKYTKEHLSGMSDFEVSKALCMLPGFYVDGVTEPWKQIINTMPNICEYWALLMPLAVEHNLTLQNVVGSGGNYWMAGPNTYHHYCDKSPQRAIACCLILVLQEKQQ